MIKIEPFRIEDAEQLCPIAVDETEREKDWRESAEINLASGPAYSGYCNGQLIGAAGIRIIREGVGEPWIVLSPEAMKCKKSAFKCLNMMMGILIEKFDFKKLRTASRIGFDNSQRLLEHLGFRRLRRTKGDRCFYVLEV